MKLRLADRMNIIDLVNRFGLLADCQEWVELRDLLADEMWIDYSDLDGFQGTRVATRTLIRSWQEQIRGFEAVQHAITNHCVDFKEPGRAVCRVHARIHHQLSNRVGGSTWSLGGVYTFGLEFFHRSTWKIQRITWRTLWSEGNPQLFYQAVENGREILAGRDGGGMGSRD